MHASCKCYTQHERKLCLLQSFCMCESQENELKENNINRLIQLFVVYISSNVLQAATPSGNMDYPRLHCHSE